MIHGTRRNHGRASHFSLILVESSAMQYRSWMSHLALPGFFSLILVVVPHLATADDATAEDEEAFRALDLTEDDYLSGKEARGALQYDQDGDRKITKEEFLAGRASERLIADFTQRDGNEDGILSGTEKRGLEDYDGNSDGEISKEEFAVGRSRQDTEVKFYENKLEELSQRHAEHFVPFTFDFPASWTYDEEAGTEANSNFVKVQRDIHLADGGSFTQENFAVGWCSIPGSGEIASALAATLAKQLQEQISQGFPNYKLNRQGPMTFGMYEGYGFDFTSRLDHPQKGAVDCWGRVVLLPAGAIEQPGGLTVIMLATSEAPELKSLADLGVKGQLPVIIKSFRAGAVPPAPMP